MFVCLTRQIRRVCRLRVSPAQMEFDAARELVITACRAYRLPDAQMCTSSFFPARLTLQVELATNCQAVNGRRKTAAATPNPPSLLARGFNALRDFESIWMAPADFINKCSHCASPIET